MVQEILTIHDSVSQYAMCTWPSAPHYSRHVILAQTRTNTTSPNNVARFFTFLDISSLTTSWMSSMKCDSLIKKLDVFQTASYFIYSRLRPLWLYCPITELWVTELVWGRTPLTSGHISPLYQVTPALSYFQQCLKQELDYRGNHCVSHSVHGEWLRESDTKAFKTYS